MSCLVCVTAGPWCAPGRQWPGTLPCDGCGRLTAWSGACGHMHCPECGREDQGDAPVPAVASGRGVVCTYPPGVKPTAGDWKAVDDFRRDLADRRRRPGTLGQRGTLQPSLAGYLADRLDPAGVTRAVALWNESMRSIPFTNPHRTALDILNGSLKWSSIPALPPLPADALAPLRAEGADVWRRRNWLVSGDPGPSSEALELTGWDVNGMYLSAGDIPLGTGAPELREWPGDEVLKLPGFVQVSTLEGAPWGIGDQWSELQWMATPLAAYLRDAGAQFLIPSALVWPVARKWLGPHVHLFREARKRLFADGTEASAEILALVKALYTRIFGAYLASERWNDGPTLRRDWLAQITGTAQARMFRALDRMRGGRVVGIHADAAWVLLPPGYEQPPGLNVDASGQQLGAFKPLTWDQPDGSTVPARVPWTPELVTAWQDGRSHPLWAALDGGEDGADDEGR